MEHQKHLLPLSRMTHWAELCPRAGLPLHGKGAGRAGLAKPSRLASRQPAGRFPPSADAVSVRTFSTPFQKSLHRNDSGFGGQRGKMEKRPRL
ncbi:MAG: hypothetical protein K9I47_11555 [Bacteroidales bacterium]|nr:hypothetical protein [Bacteroidales bacterium]